MLARVGLLGAMAVTVSLGAWADASETALGPGALLLRSSGGSELAPRVNTELQVRVAGIAARVVVKQRFVNDSAAWADGVYVFPLPNRAAVDQLQMRVGERRIAGEITERAAARASYGEARSAGRKAALVERERPNLFTSSIANIGPGESVQIEIAYWLQVHYDQGSFSLTIPTTLTPRYIPGVSNGGERQGTGWSPDTDQVPDASRITPPVTHARASASHGFGIQVTLEPGFELRTVESASHDIRSENLGARYRVTLAPAAVAMDRDFELTWRLRPSGTPEIALFVEQFNGHAHALLLAVPPVGRSAPEPEQRRELILLVDTSGSMHGLALAEAKRALAMALTELDPGDIFNVIRFSSLTRPLFPASVPANGSNIRHALEHLESLKAEGGTEMAAALLTALKQPASGATLRQVVFITDGSVGNETQLFEIIEGHLGDGRLFTVGLGAAPNGWFMRKAAEFGRGTYTRIPTMDQVSARMGALLDRLKRPQVMELAVDWPVDGAEVFPPRLPDLYADQPLVALARLDARTGLVTVTGRSGGGYWLRQATMPQVSSPGIAQLWARAQVESLLDGRSGPQGAASIKDAVLATGLSYRLLTPFTALLAVETTPSRPAHAASRQHTIPAVLPHGQNVGAIFGFPNTAANLWLKVLLGLIALTVSGGLFWGATWGVARPRPTYAS